MASLTHVCMWTEHGWKRVTADEVSRIHPGGTVSARSGIFMCELCGQYVTLTNGSIRDRYFKHSQYEKNKDCPERTFAPGAPISFSENDHGLPIKLKLSSSSRFELEMGLLPVPEKSLGKRSEGSVTIKTANGESYIYAYDRLNRDSITYVSIGNVPASSYKLIPSGDKSVLNNFWPATVDGIDPSGTIFDIRTGKKLPYDADVEVGKSYYLLKRNSLWNYRNSISVNQKCCFRHNWEYWYVYEVCASKFDGDAACFFLDLHCRLTEEPVEIYPLWPSCVEAPYLIFHKSDVLNLFFRGDATPKAFPYSYITTKGTKSGSLISLKCTGRQQLLSAGRSKILEYTYLWKDDLDNQGEVPTVVVRTIDGSTYEGGKSDHIPVNGLLEVIAQYDGEVVIEEDGKLDTHYVLHAEQSFMLDSIHLGQDIRIYQGKDMVWSCCFERQATEIIDLANDKQLLARLQKYKGREVIIPHSVGAISRYMEQYPECKKWLYEAVKTGRMDERAFRLLKAKFRGQGHD